jgi:hypothetical protein
MAKKNVNMPKKPDRVNRNSFDLIKVIALLVFIAVGIAVIGGTVWYYSFHKPGAVSDMERVSANFTKEYFNVDYTTITGQEGIPWVSAAQAKRMDASDRVQVWKDRELVARVEGDIEVKILEQGLRTGTARAIFWQSENHDEKSAKYLMYYDYDFVYEGGHWLIDRVRTAKAEDLEKFRRSRGVWEQHYGEGKEEENEAGGTE